MADEWKVILRRAGADTEEKEWHPIYEGPERQARERFRSTLDSMRSGELRLLDPGGKVRAVHRITD